MPAIFKKEWLGHFRSLTGWLFLAITLFFMGWYFRQFALLRGLPYLSYQVNAVYFIFLFTLPLITMRSFAEEKRHRTDQLLFTSPVPVWQIVLGKYLAAVCVYLPVFPLYLIFSLILGIYGPLPRMENILSVFTFIFFGLAAIGIGIFISALTESQIVAAVLTFFVLLLSSMAGSVGQLIGGGGSRIGSLLRFLDLTRPFNYSLYGVLHWPDHVFYLSVAGLALFFASFVLSAGRLNVRTHGAFGAATGLIKALMAVACIIGLNLFIYILPPGVKRIDLSYNGINSITEQTKQALSELDSGVQIYVLSSEEDADETIQATLRCMQEASGYIKLDYIDPAQQPNFYLNYADAQPAPGSVIVAGAKKSRVVDYYDCFALSYDYVYDVGSGGYIASDYKVSGYDGEGRILSAILYVTGDDVPKIYCISGHDEYAPGEELESRITNALYEMETINLLQYDDIPKDGDVVFVLSPLRDLNEEDTEKLKRFLERGGGAVFSCVYLETGQEPENFYSLLSDFGIEVLTGCVVETDAAYYNSSGEFLLPQIVDTELTEGIYSPGRTSYVYMPYAKGMRINETADVSATSFLRSSEASYVQSGRDKTDGPFALAVFARKFLPDGSSAIAVYASDYFLSPDINRAVNGSNYELFMKALAAVSETEETVDVPVKAYSYDPILVSNAARGLCSFIFILLLPAGLFAAGLAVWYYRKKN